MRATVKLFATLARFKSDAKAGKAFEVDLPEGAAVHDLIEYLKIPREETHIVFINNVIQEPSERLREGDVVGMFPPVGGG